MLGALVMQSLQSGMVLMGVDTPLQNMVVGVVLVVAVWLDTALSLAHAEGERGMSDAQHPLVEMRDMSHQPSAACTPSTTCRVDLYRRRGRGAARPQRRRQVDADQDPVGRLSSPTPARSSIDGQPADDPQPARRQGATASRRSTRPWRWPRISTPPPTCSSAASCHAAGARSTTSRWRPRRAR